MTHRRSTTSERTSLGMEMVAVAVGVGFGVVDAVTRRRRRDDRGDEASPHAPSAGSWDARRWDGRVVAPRPSASPDRVHALAGTAPS